MEYNPKIIRKHIAVEHTNKMRDLYSGLIMESISGSKIYEGEKIRNNIDKLGDTIQVFENKDTVEALFSAEGDAKIALLNFASYKYPGGGFLNGSKAQEESLCHASFLYNVLSELDYYYDYNRKHLNKSLYEDRAIYSPNILFEYGSETRFCDVITCAAPNKNAAKKHRGFSYDENHNILCSRIRLIRDIACINGVETLILGAFGSGVFKQDAYEVSDIMVSVFKCSPINKVIYAVPGNDYNSRTFKKIVESVSL